MPKPTAPFEVDIVRAALSGTRLRDVRYLEQTRSTNEDASALLGDAAALGTTIVAEYQTAGAGRKGRRWLAPSGSSLLFTTILPQSVAADTLWAVPFWIALAVAGAVERCCLTMLDLVWPNDLYARGKKIGGILSVARIAGNAARVGCGVGLNVFRPSADVELDALDPQPVFLNELNATSNREALLTEILLTFDRTFEQLQSPQAVAREWERRAALNGTMYRYRRDSDGIERDGIAERIGAHGVLVLRDAAGETAIDMADVRITGRIRAT